MVTTKTYRSAEAELLPSQLIDPQPVLFHMFIPSQVQDFVLAFAEPHEVPVSPSRSQWVSVLPFSISAASPKSVSSVNWLRVCSVPLSHHPSLWWRHRTISSSTVTWDIPPVASHQLNFALLIATLWHPAIQTICHQPCGPLIQTISFQSGYKDIIRDCKVKVDNIHCSLCIHRRSHLLTEGWSGWSGMLCPG